MGLATYYEILNVSPRASDAEVHRAYRAQAMRWHPDQHPHDRQTAERIFRQISRAYTNLKTHPQRVAYNRALLNLMQVRYEAQRAFPFGWIRRRPGNRYHPAAGHTGRNRRVFRAAPAVAA